MDDLARQLGYCYRVGSMYAKEFIGLGFKERDSKDRPFHYHRFWYYLYE